MKSVREREWEWESGKSVQSVRLDDDFYYLIFSFIFGFYNLFWGLYPKPRGREGSDYMKSMHLCFLLFLFSVALIVLSYGDEQFRKVQFSRSYPSSYYYWYGSNVNVSPFLNVYFQIMMIIINITLCEFFTHVLTGGFSQESEWQ